MSVGLKVARFESHHTVDIVIEDGHRWAITKFG
jgi:hypothetical protein